MPDFRNSNGTAEAEQLSGVFFGITDVGTPEPPRPSGVCYTVPRPATVNGFRLVRELDYGQHQQFQASFATEKTPLLQVRIADGWLNVSEIECLLLGVLADIKQHGLYTEAEANEVAARVDAEHCKNEPVDYPM